LCNINGKKSEGFFGRQSLASPSSQDYYKCFFKVLWQQNIIEGRGGEEKEEIRQTRGKEGNDDSNSFSVVSLLFLSF